jgi:hypothetical protein
MASLCEVVRFLRLPTLPARVVPEAGLDELIQIQVHENEEHSDLDAYDRSRAPEGGPRRIRAAAGAPAGGFAAGAETAGREGRR